MAILLTGGAGYIGSHTAVELIDAGNEVVIADDLSNSSAQVVDRIFEITGKRPAFHEVDIADHRDLCKVFEQHQIDAVVHFAGLKAVGESVNKPIRYYRNNLDTTLTLLEVMKQYGCKNLAFSSSATVYGNEFEPPFTEDMPTGNCTNPYGWTKHMIEQILRDTAAADPDLSVVLLRYFNPTGAHPSGLIGERPNGIPNNLMPYVMGVAAGIYEKLSVYGSDYPTPDGTGIRDYIHVVDLAKGHLAALRYAMGTKGLEVFNLGSGKGHSVLELVKTFMETNKVNVPFEIAPRRDGDVAVSFADASKAKRLLRWQTERTLQDMCRDAWSFEKRWETDHLAIQGETK